MDHNKQFNMSYHNRVVAKRMNVITLVIIQQYIKVLAL